MTNRHRPRIAACALFLAIALVPALARSEDWTPATPDELTLKTSTVEAGADAEALLWEISVDDAPEGDPSSTVLDHYLRVKIFTAAGAEKFGQVAVTYGKSSKVRFVRARTTRADGSVVSLAKDAVFTSTLAKQNRREIRTTSFALPGVEPGAIVEYRYRETRQDFIAHNMELPLQRDIPVQLVRYIIRPLASRSLSMRTTTFHVVISPFRQTGMGFHTTTAKNLPAFVEEPYMPPEAEVSGWLLIHYSDEARTDPDSYWRDLGERTAKWFETASRPNGHMRTLAASSTEGASEPTARLRRLFDWCRTNVRNRTDDALANIPAPDKKIKPNESAADVFARRAGTSSDVNLLFATLARAAGFDVRLASMSDRDRFFFDPRMSNAYFLVSSAIAVRLDGAWRCFSPGDTRMPFGMLRWQEDGQQALLCDRDSTRFMELPMATPGFTTQTRVADLALSEDGTLDGELRITLEGHMNRERRLDEAGESVAERVKRVTDRYQKTLGTAEVSNVRFDDTADGSQPYVISLHLRVPDYARRMGRRLLLQPNLFEKGATSSFPSSTRRYPVYFRYPWSEQDSVRIRLPQGYAVDEAEQPKGLDISGVGSYFAYMRLTPDARTLIYTRAFRFGDRETIYFPKESYPLLKQTFDAIEQRDAHSLTIFDPAAPE
jgi:hypothetical protein